MKSIKRFDSYSLSKKFGLELNSSDFLFKPTHSHPAFNAEPHRSAMYSLSLITSGLVELKVGLNKYCVQAPGLIAIVPDDVRIWITDPRAVKTQGLFFTEEFIVSGLSNTLFLKELPIYKKSGGHVIALTPYELSMLTILFNQVEEKNESTDHKKLDIIQALLRVILLETINLQETRDPGHSGKHSQAHYLTEKFKELLSANFSAHRVVGYYAERLFISPKHLSQTVKEETGKTARELIDEIVCLEAKILLQGEKLNISEISQQLSFTNASFFGKFFKRTTGMSPQQYRKGLIK